MKLLGRGLCAVLLASLLRGAEGEIVVRTDVKVPMRDGVLLSANVFLPPGEGRFPVILMRTPYGKGDAKNGGARAYARSGYAYVVQDTRGRGQSQGRFAPFLNEAEDGFDTQEWVRAQPWCDGRIGTAGGSYVGFTQWLPAPLGSPALKAMVPVVTFDDFHEVMYVGGAFQLSLALGWGAMVSSPPGEALLAKDVQGILRTLPLTDYPRLLGRQIDFYNDWLAHPENDEYWRPATVKDKYARIAAPVLGVGGWYDIFAKATLDNFARMRKEAPTEALRKAQRVVMGPGAHGLGSKIGARDFGAAANIDVGALERRWFDRWLKGIPNGVDDEAPVRIFVMGINQWRDEHEWPLARTRWTKYYLRGKGGANTAAGDGVLAVEPPGDEPCDRFRYDPADPVPTMGGANLVLAPIGPYDQREVEKRKDVLVYTTPPLAAPVEVTGPVVVVLYAASSAKDTDFTAKLVDVCPDGTAWNLTDGIVRARYRASDKAPELIEPGKVYAYTIDLWVTSNVFLAGHAMRLEISSSNFPRFDRNLNTGGEFARDGAHVAADQSVYHDRGNSSHVLLPIVP
ncbi:MAG TPA: CocE/NonD family hydrolase [Planctomycetota bacterium]|jgi:hypothetical protein|nr:CocE/NonD family hydrolase [Planctomycetota bacterium]OQC21926.1 MAG: Cocaine esterase [Planctomycetes bacterium ADurb.Bin069]NMD35371.1 CocE/NonD family hydrolase [Planctomycetota bacterium]HNS00024.1 CocE/NonD family hydrolase [Planctomycetota bacterium]HNU27046.1 CocE/NonD family hydrolase [Planctomycetota bacterium]